jgi:hypothetical protein
MFQIKVFFASDFFPKDVIHYFEDKKYFSLKKKKRLIYTRGVGPEMLSPERLHNN